MIKDGFKEIFQISEKNFKFVLKHIDDICSFENMCIYSIDITGDAMLDENLF